MVQRRPRVLFLCTGNSCRSQMAEGWLRELAGERFEALSAGTRPQDLNPGAVRAMAEVGIDIAEQRSQHIDAFLEDPPEYLISVCDGAAEACPEFSAATTRMHWPFPDPAHATGSEEQVHAEFARVRNSIEGRLRSWLGASEEGAPALDGGPWSPGTSAS